jgi:hypothetical protein
LERELGRPVLAISCHAIDPAPIGDEDLAKIKQLEERLGVSSVAVAA